MMRTLVGCAIVAVAAASLQGSVRRVNYDESKVGEYRLEDPLVRIDGSRLSGAADWAVRRREILSVLEREEYGRWPESPETLVVDKIEEGKSLLGEAHRQQFAMFFKADRSGPRIDWLLLTPAHAKGPVPVVIILNSHGNHELLTDDEVHVHDAWMPKRYAKDKDADPHRATAKTRGAVRWPIDMVLARGYAVLTACFQQGAADPDADEMPVEEVRRSGCYPLWTDSEDIGTLIVWGWQLARGLDLAERQPSLDAKRSVVFGCSRLAKAALLAGAFDERFAVVAVCQSGGGGAPLWKRQFGENVDWMDQEFRHWYRKGFMKYVSNEQAMPFDQHLLLAAVAPRHLLIEGFNEPWYDTRGEYLACRAASLAWEFLGKPGLPAGGFPENYSEAAIGSHLGYARRGGSHGISGYDWKWLLDFADRAFGWSVVHRTGF